MSIQPPSECESSDSNKRRRRRRKRSAGVTDDTLVLGRHIMEGQHTPNAGMVLPTPSEDVGRGDILYGLFPDPTADAVEEVRKLRRR